MSARAMRYGAAANLARASRPAAPVEPPAPPAETLVGTLERLTVYNGWGVGSVWNDERKSVKVTGEALAELVEGLEYEFSGRAKVHPQHGDSFDVTVAHPYINPDRRSIVKFLVRNFQGLTELKAKRFVDGYTDGKDDEGAALEELRQRLLTQPWSLDLTAVSRRAQFKTDEGSSPLLAFVHRDLSTRLAGFPGIRDEVLKGLAAYLLQRAQAGAEQDDGQGVILDPRLIEKCWADLVRDPYAPIRSVSGYGFGTADAIGSSVNIPFDEPVRLKALVLHALNEGCNRGGHTYLTYRQIAYAIRDVDQRVAVDTAIEYGLQEQFILLDQEFGEQRYYTPDLLETEVSLATRVAEMCEDDKPLVKVAREGVIARIAQVVGRVAPDMRLDPSQLEALVGLMTSRKRLHTLTAGPGCGKTALMEILSEVLKSRNFVFCGPTGKSAKQLSKRLAKHGRSAATGHSTLAGSCSKDFTYNASNPLEGDVLVLDESSMADNDLADGVLAAACHMHVVLLGDDDQLPSVAPGAFLREVRSLSCVDHHRLTKTHRNSGGILEVIEQVREGRVDCVDRAAVKFSHHLGEAADQFHVVAQQYVGAVSRHGFENVILLIPKRKGDVNTPGWNTTYANGVLRQMCNPNAEKLPGSARLHVGDRIIIRANMSVNWVGGERPPEPVRRSHDDDPSKPPQTRVVNGDTGTVVSYRKHEPKKGGVRQAGVAGVRLHLDDGRDVEFPGSSLELLQHSYALTVHSGQGSEYEHVIMIAPPASRSFNNRPMLFTGVSRARGRLEIHGEDADVQRIAATEAPRRNSALAQRVRRLRGEEDLPLESDGDDEWEGVEDDEQEPDVVAQPVASAAMSSRARRFMEQG